jgi:hypothetical protein
MTDFKTTDQIKIIKNQSIHFVDFFRQITAKK